MPDGERTVMPVQEATEATNSPSVEDPDIGGEPMVEFDTERHERRSRQLHERTSLSERQAQVVAAKEQGLSHAQIAEELGLSKGVVDKHSTRARSKVQEARSLLEDVDDVYPNEDG